VDIRIGTAGWAIGTAAQEAFPGDGSSLERYARVLPVSEINSSFHRPHRPATWERWRDSVPGTFRFSVKMPKTISHQRKLEGCNELLTEFLEQAEILGDKLAILLLQLPPKLAFDAPIAGAFLETLRKHSPAAVVVEPRHPSWLEAPADRLLADLEIARVAADPAMAPAAALPGGWRGLHYWRLHGSPVRYRSSYADRIAAFGEALTSADADATERWCIFDNTASSAAIADAVALQSSVERLQQ